MMKKLAVISTLMIMVVDAGWAQAPYWNRERRDEGEQRYSGSIDRKLDEVRESYRRGDFRRASARLRQIAAELDRLGAAQQGPVLPRFVRGWSLNKTKRKDHQAGAFTVTSHYLNRKKGLYANLHKGTDEAIDFIRSISRSGWLRRSAYRTYNIQGYTGKLASDGRLYVIIDRETLLELKYTDDDTSDRDLLGFASALDIQRLRWAR